jgi:hypothetical protein
VGLDGLKTGVVCCGVEAKTDLRQLGFDEIG